MRIFLPLFALLPLLVAACDVPSEPLSGNHWLERVPHELRPYVGDYTEVFVTISGFETQDDTCHLEFLPFYPETRVAGLGSNVTIGERLPYGNDLLIGLTAANSWPELATVEWKSDGRIVGRELGDVRVGNGAFSFFNHVPIEGLGGFYETRWDGSFVMENGVAVGLVTTGTFQRKGPRYQCDVAFAFEAWR